LQRNWTRNALEALRSALDKSPPPPPPQQQQQQQPPAALLLLLLLTYTWYSSNFFQCCQCLASIDEQNITAVV